MNERIRELIDETISFRLDPDSNAYEALIHPEDLEMFAELIVRECNRYACSAWEHGPLLGKDLLIHFGIEEADDGDIKS